MARSEPTQQELYDDYGDRLRIDRDDLEREEINHPNNAWRVREQHALAVSRKDQKKFELDVAYAECDHDVREQMTADEEKITEDLVKAAIRRDQKYHRAYNSFLNASEWAARWEALADSFKDRTYMLRDLMQKRLSERYDDAVGTAERRVAHSEFNRRRTRLQAE